MLAGLIMLIIGAAIVILVIRFGDSDSFPSIICMACGIALAAIGFGTFPRASVNAIESRFADKDVLSDGGYYRILSVTKNPDDPNTQYVIYTPKQGTVRDVCLTSTNNTSIPTGMVKWNSADQTFTSLPIEARN